MIEILSYRVNYNKIEEFRFWLNKDYIVSLTQIEETRDDELPVCFQVGYMNERIKLRFKERVQATILHQQILQEIT